MISYYYFSWTFRLVGRKRVEAVPAFSNNIRSRQSAASCPVSEKFNEVTPTSVFNCDTSESVEVSSGQMEWWSYGVSLVPRIRSRRRDINLSSSFSSNLLRLRQRIYFNLSESRVQVDVLFHGPLHCFVASVFVMNYPVQRVWPWNCTFWSLSLSLCC